MKLKNDRIVQLLNTNCSILLFEINMRVWQNWQTHEILVALLQWNNGDIMEDVFEAHMYSANHMEQLVQDSVCGCFYCCRIFRPSEITEWIEDTSRTAVCPYCGVDSIIGESSGFPITEEFLKRMRERWFTDFNMRMW